MKTLWPTALAVLWLATGALAAQERRPWNTEPAAEPAGTPAPPTDAMSWQRDFDLLLEVDNKPTRDQVLRVARREALVKERDALQARLDDDKKRLATIQNSYSTEALLQEMIRQDVADFQSVQKNLTDDVRETSRRLTEVRAQIKRLDDTEPR